MAWQRAGNLLVSLAVLCTACSCALGPGGPQVRTGGPAAAGQADAANGETQAASREYADARQNMDRVYQEISAHMNLEQQLVLSAEQTVWLNTRDLNCEQSGADGYACDIEMTRERTRELAEILPRSRRRAPAPVEVASRPRLLLAQQTPAPASPRRVPALVKPKPRLRRAAPEPAIVLAQRQPGSAPTEKIEKPVNLALVAQRQPDPGPAARLQAPAMPAPHVQVPPQAPVALSQSATLQVAATAMPWIWKKDGINAPFKFGYPDGTPPAALKLAGLNAKPGGRLTIQYMTGRITLGPGTPTTDALGYTELNNPSETGPTGKYPGAYIRSGAASPGALVGVFTKADGSIVGAPFGVGDGPATVAIPRDASKLQLGINDDIFGAETPGAGNAGALTVKVFSD